MVGILVVDDQKAIRKNLAFYLKSQGYDVDSSETGEEALEKIKDNDFDIIITDYKLDKMTGHELMIQARVVQPTLEVIIMTGVGNVPMAVEVIRDGAADFISKPFEYSTILDSIGKIIKHRQIRTTAKREERYKIVAASQKMKDIADLATKAAAAEVSILIEGEIGTGKELFARIVHQEGRRCRNNFVVVECASSEEPVLEHEIFGGNDDDNSALIRADGGTLLLRDIDCLTPKLQARLLRYMREGTFAPADSSTLKKVDARIIATTVKSLKQLVSNGEFREDLYYLLNVMPVYIPPLRSRNTDVMPLVKYFLIKYNAQNNKNIKAIAPEVISWLESYGWPGNVQEVENVISRACVLATEDILDESLIFTLPQDRPCKEEDQGFLNITLKDNQRTLILKALKQNNSNFSRTASQLGISRTTLWRRLKKFKIDGLPVEKE
jgi:two-component system response regulator HydG